MPLYEYRCPQGDEFQVSHGAEERPEVRCPSCGLAAERVFSAPMVHTQFYFSSQIKSYRRPRWRPPDDAPATKPDGAGR